MMERQSATSNWTRRLQFDQTCFGLQQIDGDGSSFMQSAGLRDQSRDMEGCLFLHLGRGRPRTPYHHKFTEDGTPAGGDEQRTEVDPGQICDAPIHGMIGKY
jgi:hypothetical protein